MNDEITILIVDDDPDVLFATSRVVRSEGYRVITASSGEECKAILKKGLPDLILLDVILPGIQGPELCKELKSNPAYKEIFIILISGMKTASGEQAYGLQEGADGYIGRPISNPELKARIKAMVRILKAERERDDLIVELKDALSKIKRLSGLLPICAHCKKIRNDHGYWEQIEAYIQKHSEADFSHSICQECAAEHYPGIDI